MIATPVPARAWPRDPARRPWWPHVRVIPEAKRRAVFTRGRAKGWIGSIPTGGQVHPISGVGLSALWKNAQKKPKKNIASEIRNSKNPSRRPRQT